MVSKCSKILFLPRLLSALLIFQIAESSNAFLNRMLNRDTITRITYKSKYKTNNGLGRVDAVSKHLLFLLKTTTNGSLFCVITLYLPVSLPITFRDHKVLQGQISQIMTGNLTVVCSGGTSHWLQGFVNLSCHVNEVYSSSMDLES